MRINLLFATLLILLNICLLNDVHASSSTTSSSASSSSTSSSSTSSSSKSSISISVGSSQNSGICDAGYYATAGNICVKCPAGTFKLAKAKGSCTSCTSNSAKTNNVGSTTFSDACYCTPGYRLAVGQQSCEACPKGSYKSTTDNSQCVTCPSGSTTGSTAATSLLSCSGSGYIASGNSLICNSGYYNSDAQTCSACPIDTYKSTTGSGGCIACPTGSTTNSQQARTSSSACQAKFGWVSNGTNTFTCAPGYGGTNCESCPANYYKSNTGFSACTACPSGTSTLLQKSRTSVTSCFGLGYIPVNGALICSLGFYSDGQGNCLGCPYDTYKETFGAGNCSACAVGTSTNGLSPSISKILCFPRSSYTIFLKCNTGFYGSGCLPCPVDTYKSTLGSDICTPCPSGTSTAGKTGQYFASQCTASTGWISNGNGGQTCAPGYTGSTCQQCPANTYKNSTGVSSCTPCPIGSSTNGTTQQTSVSGCLALPGWTSVNGSTFVCVPGKTGSTCSPCPANTYKATSGNNNCTYCPNGSSTSGVLGATSANSCIALPNWVATGDGQFTCDAGYTGINCSPCSANTFKSNTGTSPCTSCPIGTSTKGAVAQVRDASCIPEDGWIVNGTSGFTCNKGFGGSNCTACASGTYKTNIGFNSCTVCPSNSVATTAQGQSSIQNACSCNYGYFGLVGNLSSCSACPIGSYKTTIENKGNCTTCPIGSTTLSVGASDPSYCIASPGYTSDGNNGFTCNAGYYGNNCTACPAGSFKPNAGSNTTCTFCDLNTTASANLAGQISTTTACLCKPGFFTSPINNGSCTSCPMDSYKDFFGGSAQCKPCPTNSSTYGATAATKLTNCVPLIGYLFNTSTDLVCNTGYGGPNCVQCTSDTYKSTTGYSDCTPCPYGSWTNNTVGQTSVAACVALPGFVLQENSTFSCLPGYGTKDCTPCPSGTFKSNISSDSCQSCPANSIASNITGSTAAADACLCSGGYFGLSGNMQNCTSCVVDTFKTGLGNIGACIPCPVGTSTNYSIGNEFANECSILIGWVPDANGAYTCDTGYFGDECTTCASGTFKSAIGNFSCSLCPENSQSNGLSGQTSVSSACLCSIGYAYSNNTTCSACPPDTYNSFATNGTNCSACITGTSTMGVTGAFSASQCHVLPNYIGDGSGGYTCGAGFSGSSCSACAPGSYKSVIGSSSCVLCPNNSIGNGLFGQSRSSTGCSCSPGFYSVYSSSSELTCTACPADSWKYGTGNYDCVACPYGSSTYGQIGAQTIAQCLVKTNFTSINGTNYCSPGHAGANCAACPAGSFKQDAGISACSLCPTGSVSNGQTGQLAASTACICQPGFYGMSDLNPVCSVCPADTYKSTNGNGSCVACPTGTSTFGAQAQTSVNSCVPKSGYANSTTCAVGYQGTNTANGLICSPCPVDYYKNTAGNGPCTSCNAWVGNVGPYVTNGAQGSSYCYSSIGYYPAPGQTYFCDYGFGGNNCDPCVSGMYKSVTGYLPCSKCPANSTSSGLTAQRYPSQGCTCVAGYYGLSDFSSSSCQVCPTDSFKNFTGNAAMCTNCVFGTTTGSTTGATSQNSCVPKTGFTQMIDGSYQCSAGRSGLQCNLCSPGSYKTSSGFAACQMCPFTMTSTSVQGATSLESACQCAVGFTNFSSTGCFACGAGTYKPDSGNSACLTCPQGSTSNPGSASCDCTNGYYRSNTSCVSCPVDTFGNNGSCAPCAFGYGTNGTVGQEFCVPKIGYLLDSTNNTMMCSTGYGFNSSSLTCDECAVDTFKMTNGNSSCSPCLNGLSTGAERGASACAAPAGYYVSLSGNLVSCNADSYKLFGNSSSCVPCPWGTSTYGAMGATNSTACVKKPNTFELSLSVVVCIAGYEPHSENCAPCAQGFYKPSVGNQACDKCASNETGNLVSGSTSCIDAGNTATSAMSTQSSNLSESSTYGTAIGGAVAGVVLMVFIVGGLLYKLRHKQAPSQNADPYRNPLSIYTITTNNLNKSATVNDQTRTNFDKQMPIAFPLFLNLESEESISLISKIGEGGFATIYAAKLEEEPVIEPDGPLVACKVFKKRRDEDAARSDFETEVSALYALQMCPNVARLIAVSTDTEFRIVMKLYTESVSAYLHSPFSKTSAILQEYNHSAVALAMSAQMMYALKTMHSMDMVHLDIKPGNMLLDILNPDFQANGLDILPVRLVICDFGNVRMISNKQTVKGLRSKVTNGLSVNYAAPEAINVTRLLDTGSAVDGASLQRMDVYSACSSVFELLARKVPFAKRSVYEIQQDLLQGVRPDWSNGYEPSSQPEKCLYNDLRALAVDGWQQNPVVRPTMSELLDQTLVLLEIYSKFYDI